MAEETIWDELTSPLNLALILVIVFLIYKIIRSKFEKEINVPPPQPQLPKLRKDLTVAELKKYDGTQSDGRVLLGVNGVIFDVTRGKRFYGPGGPYAAFAGSDATRGLATGSVAGSDKEYDDCSDLTPDEQAAAKEWEDQFRGRQTGTHFMLLDQCSLATGSVAGSDKEYDDCSDLTPDEQAAAKEWEDQFREKYDIVGKLLKPGETPNNYEETETETKKEL